MNSLIESNRQARSKNNIDIALLKKNIMQNRPSLIENNEASAPSLSSSNTDKRSADKENITQNKSPRKRLNFEERSDENGRFTFFLLFWFIYYVFTYIFLTII